MDSGVFALVVVLGLVLANGFFVATEFAIVAVRRSRLDQLAATGDRSAVAAQSVVGRLDTYIAACQLGITMASLALGWVGEPAFAHLVEPPLEVLIGSFAPAAAHAAGVAVSFAIITTLHIVIGELAPKGLALQKPVATSLAVARPLLWFERIFRLPIRLLNSVGNWVLRLAGLEPASGHEMVHSVEELRLLVTGSAQAGVVDEVEARIASHAFALGETTLGELMTPRTELHGLPVTASVGAGIDLALRSGHTRLVVYDGTLDEILGVVHLRDLVGADRRGQTDLRQLLRPVLVVPATKAAAELLDEMRAARREVAVAIDEFGGTAGIATLENIIEALVGRIEEEEPAGQLPVGGADVELVDGLLRIDELEELQGVRVAPAVRAEVDTVGGLVMATLGRLPRVGDEVQVDGRTLRVEALDGRRVATLRLLPASVEPSSSTPNST
jgi:CBS domain containing-hemolysin-like protein